MTSLRHDPSADRCEALRPNSGERCQLLAHGDTNHLVRKGRQNFTWPAEDVKFEYPIGWAVGMPTDE